MGFNKGEIIRLSNMVYQKLSAHPTNPVHFSFKTKPQKTPCISFKAQSPLPFAG